MPKDKQVQVGRLAMRHEGRMWNAYFAKPGTMEGAIQIGSIAMAGIAKSPTRYNAFLQMMTELVGDIINDISGEMPSWTGAEPAPENERAGHS